VPGEELPKVLIVHNFTTPYRLPLFERVGQSLDLDVWFCGTDEVGRRWGHSPLPALEKMRVRYLPSRRVGHFLLNWGLISPGATRTYDVVILDEDIYTITASLMVALSCLLSGTPLVVWSEHVIGSSKRHRSPAARAGGSIYRVVRRLLLRQAEAVIAMSGEAAAEEIRALTAAPPRIVLGQQIMPEILMPGPVEEDRGRADRPAVTVLFLGYLRPEKNVADLIACFRRIAAPEHQLVIAGDGPMRPDLERTASGASNIRFAGHVSGDDKARELRACDVLVVPSFYEPWGLVVNESLFVGTPVIADRSVGAAQLISDGRTGLLYGPETRYPDLEAALRAYLGDAGLRAGLRLGAEAADRTPLFDLDVGAGAILESVDRVWRDRNAVSRLESQPSNGSRPTPTRTEYRH
jgi:glycosyltransferase involved in cell wall biosynthesis